MASTPGTTAFPTPPATANTQSIGPLGSLEHAGRRRQGRPPQAGRLVGVLGLGDPAVQLRHPDLRLRRAVPRLATASCRRTSPRSPTTTRSGARARRALERLRLVDDAGRHADPAARAGARAARGRAGRRKAGSSVFTDAARARCSSACSSCRPTRRSSGSARRSSRSARSSPRSPASTTTRCSCRCRPDDHRQGQRARLGPRLHRRHRRARHRRRADMRRLVRHRHLERPRVPAHRGRLRACGRSLFAIPIFLNVPEAPAGRPRAPKVGFFESYVRAGQGHRAALPRDPPDLLVPARQRRSTATGSPASSRSAASSPPSRSASAPNEVIIFGIAANLVAGVSTIIAGRFDDRFGPEGRHRHRAVRPRRDGRRRVRPARPRHDRVLGRRPGPCLVRRPGAGREPLAPGAGHAGRAAGRDLRPLRDDRARREVPLARRCGRSHRDLRRARSSACSASCSCCSSASC